MREANAFRIAMAAACALFANASWTRAETRAHNGAQSRVALPFTCAYEPASRRLRMTPAAEQVYEIADRRQTRRAVVCHPTVGCRTWVLHRFHMLCGGHRVAWLNVVAATLAPMRGQRVTIEDGRLVLTRPIPAVRSARSNCFDRLAGSGIHVQRRLFGDGVTEDCWQEPGPSQRAGLEWRIALPPGFAPGRLVSARFLAAPREEIAATGDAAPATAPVAATEPAPDSASVVAFASNVTSTPDPVAIPAKAGAADEKSEASAPKDAVEGSTETSGAVPVRSSPRSTVSTAQNQEREQLSVAPETAVTRQAGVSAGPVVGEQAEPSTTELVVIPRQSEPQASTSEAAAGAVRGAAETDTTAAASDAAPTAGRQAAGAADAFAVEPYWAAPGIALGVAGLVWLLWLVRRRRWQRTAQPHDLPLVALAAPGARGPDADAIAQLAATATENLARCRECLARLPAALPIRVVIARELNACVERLGKLATEQLETTEEVRRIRLRLQAITRDLQRLAAIAEGASSSMTAGALVPVEIAEPRDRFEAYAVLGVNPDVEPRVLKKLVDALRQSWHPDQARDEADRRRREDRIKQINVAWDIIQGKRVEA